RAGLLALAVVGAGPEVLLHRLHHRLGAPPPLRLALRQQVEVGDLGGGEQVGGPVGAGGDTRPTADAGGGVEGGVGDLLGDGDEVGVGGRAGVDRDVAAGLDDLVERRPVHYQVLDDWEGGGPPRLHDDRVAVPELAHVQLAGGGAELGAV